MSDFIHEQIVQLNHVLSELFQNVNTSNNVESRHDPMVALDTNDQQLFLTCISREIDLLTAVPDISVVKKYLQLYIQHPMQGDLAWLFIAKCTVAVYGYMLSNTLNSTLPLSEAANYWNGVYGSRRHETYYALQTLPIRISRVGIHTIKMLRTANIESLLKPEQLFRNMFPKQQKSLRFFSIKQNKFTQLIHEEIRQKLQQLEYYKKLQASKLGLMMKLAPFTTTKNVSMQSAQCITMMKSTLGFDQVDVNQVMQAQVSEGTTLDAAKGLLNIIQDWDQCQLQIDLIKNANGPPSFITKYWIPGIIGCVAGNMVVQLLTARQDDIIAWSKEIGITARDFAVNWIWEPVLQVWDTIRLKDERLSVLGKEGLRSDSDSLQRMVAEFARDHYRLPENQVVELMSRVREGDMSMILKAYEEEIKHPLKNAVKGDLIQTLLIQVQKTKVDVDLAMAALDKLLKSNELNFAFLAVAPSMLLTWGAVAWLRRCYDQRTGQRIGKTGLPMQQAIRRLERLLTLSYSEENELDCETQGIILCEVHLLRSYAAYLPSRNSIRDLFIEDLRDLENPKLSITQKLQTINRMSRSWSFLKHPI
ncbi:ATP synthase regulation protein NCA2 [Mucor ambiguus]|uniref:ATP synthase regulation protein NCA2 n=1 Tax=Mucor ambiguus TaxID=91626 RepID=A0A0C9N2B1_9FUNG|nr:ATP synthase regulation protein NCA2 [Mucor ambiguus]